MSGRLCLLLFRVSLYRHIPLKLHNLLSSDSFISYGPSRFFPGSQQSKWHLIGKVNCDFPVFNSNWTAELQTHLACFKPEGLWKRQAQVDLERTELHQRYLLIQHKKRQEALSQSHHSKCRGLVRFAEGGLERRSICSCRYRDISKEGSHSLSQRADGLGRHCPALPSVEGQLPSSPSLPDSR